MLVRSTFVVVLTSVFAVANAFSAACLADADARAAQDRTPDRAGTVDRAPSGHDTSGKKLDDNRSGSNDDSSRSDGDHDDANLGQPPVPVLDRLMGAKPGPVPAHKPAWLTTVPADTAGAVHLLRPDHRERHAVGPVTAPGFPRRTHAPPHRR